MRFRVATLNLDQDHKRWDARRHLIGEEIANLRPDILALNEVSVPLQSARGLRKSAAELTGVHYNLVQQARANSLSKIEGEALLTRFPVLETGNLDYQTRDMVALVARILIDDAPLDVYVTHLYMSRGDDSLRLFQVQQLLAWIDTRDDVPRASFAATSTPAWICRPLRSWPPAFVPPRRRQRPSRRSRATTVRCPIPIGPGWAAASITSGRRAPSRSLPAESASIEPVRTTPRCGRPITPAFGPTSGWHLEPDGQAVGSHGSVKADVIRSASSP